MPDLKSEMSKVIQQWNPEPTTMNNAEPTPTIGSTHRTFDCIKNNPGKTRSAIRDILAAEGVKVGSSTSLISQMVRNGNVNELNGLLYAAHDTYVAQSRQQAPVEAAAPAAWSANDVIDTLSVRQARAVMDELIRLFEGGV